MSKRKRGRRDRAARGTPRRPQTGRPTPAPAAARPKPAQPPKQAKRAKQSKQTKRASAEVMFFPRLRRQAKWAFVLLTLAFAIGFLGFGVGAGGIGLGDLIQGRSSSSGADLADLKAKTRAEPKNATAWRELATAYQTRGELAPASEALERYLALAPDDEAALSELATLNLSRAEQLRQRLIALEAQLPQTGLTQLPGPFGQALGENAIEQALAASVETQMAPLEAQYSTLLDKALATYKRLAASSKEPTVSLQVAQLAEQQGDYQTALAYYNDFLEKAPDDPLAKQVRAHVRDLKKTVSQATVPVAP